MSSIESQISTLLARREKSPIQVQTLGGFQVWREGQLLSAKDWGRDKTIQLFQFFVTARHRKGLHKEQIIDRIWGDEADEKSGNQNFKIALHGINKVLEPNRPSRTEAKYIIRQGLTYQLNTNDIWIDVDMIEQLIALGNQALLEQPLIARKAYRTAIEHHQGVYLPNRLYEDWSSEVRERLQVLTLGGMITLSELLLEENPMESIRLTQQALLIDHAWEDAYRIQMKAYLAKGNRPMAIKTYKRCEEVLEEEFGLNPLPETKNLLKEIMAA